MASLNRIRLDAKRINEGAWVTVEADGEPFEIQTRGFTPRYRDTLHRLRTDAVRMLNRGRDPGSAMVSMSDLPPSIDDECYGKVLAKECFLNVRGLKHSDDGPEVTAEEFKELLCDPESCGPLVMLAMGAAAQVTSDRDAQIESASGNSATASGGT